jgi:GMP synthase-like glutamine amidotransferase
MATDGPQRFPRIRRKLRGGKGASMHGEAVLERPEAARAIASGDSCRTIAKQYEIAPSRW